ncbi:MAG TPA: hypothetical protein VHZ73_03455 [Vicinamibacterales bacterium]|nr:hypothetical protein [Vicinamibacterales bacterium]
MKTVDAQGFGLACLVVALIVSGCSAHPERSTIDEFLNASKLLDKTALSHMATVVFDPQESGIVERFDVANIRDDGETRKIVTVDADVKLPRQDALSEETIVLTLTKNALPSDPQARDRWIVTGFTARLGTPAKPRP